MFFKDVTKRYVIDHNALKQRRNWVSDDWLNKLLMDQTDQWQKNIKSSDLKTELAQLRLNELAELMFAKPTSTLSQEESQGRQSGSLAWRLSRQETKLESAGANKYIILPTSREQESMVIDVSLDINADAYLRASNGDESIKGWRNMAFMLDNVFLKEEFDWNMRYIARKGK